MYGQNLKLLLIDLRWKPTKSTEVLVWEFIIAFFSCERGFEECNAIFM
jgi:hypothetical protein